MESFIELIQHFWADLQNGQVLELGYWTYVVLALLAMVQGPLATLLGAAAASAGLLRPGLVFIAAVTGHLTADTGWYWVGHAGKIEWFKRWLPAYREHVDKLQQGMHQNASKILFLGKLSAGFAVPTLIAAGLARIAWRRWFPVVFVGEMLWTTVLMLVGYYATGAIIQRVDRGVLYLIIGFSILFVIMLFWYIPRAMRQEEELSELAIDEDR
jgi:membrane protein DedA with SNARE-associated domain